MNVGWVNRTIEDTFHFLLSFWPKKQKTNPHYETPFGCNPFNRLITFILHLAESAHAVERLVVTKDMPERRLLFIHFFSFTLRKFREMFMQTSLFMLLSEMVPPILKSQTSAQLGVGTFLN